MACCIDGVSHMLDIAVAWAKGDTRKATHKNSLPKPDFKGKGRRFVRAHSYNSDRLSGFYAVGENKGSGAFGAVRLATAIQTGKMCVVKTVRKPELPEEAFALLANELEILSFCDHPNIIRLYQTFEDDVEVHCVMQYCSGGDLFDRLCADGPFCEAGAKSLMRQLLGSVHYLHTTCCIAHRDIKLENVMLKQHDCPLSESQIKLIDFGFARGFQPGLATFDEICGTPGYFAPEVLKGIYNEKCDIFSCGVILYEMLCSSQPFKQKSNTTDPVDGFTDNFYRGQLYFREPEWECASTCLKTLTTHMCKACPMRRISAQQALQSFWISNDPIASASPGGPTLLESVRSNMRRVSDGKNLPIERLQTEALQLVAYHMEDKDIQEEQKLFTALDKDGNGSLCKGEIVQLCSHLGMSEEDAVKLFAKLDTDLTGKVGYTEFLSAAIQGKECCQKPLRAAFCAFDHDNDGSISMQELRNALHKVASDEDILDIMQHIDQNRDGQVDYQEFISALPLSPALP